MIDRLFHGVRARIAPEIPMQLGARHQAERQGERGIVVFPVDDAFAEVDRALVAVVPPPPVPVVSQEPVVVSVPSAPLYHGGGVPRVDYGHARTMRAIGTRTTTFEAWVWAPSVDPQQPQGYWGDPLQYGDWTWGGKGTPPAQAQYLATEQLVAIFLTALKREVGRVSLVLQGGTWAQEDQETTGASYRLRFGVRGVVYERVWALGVLDGIEQVCIYAGTGASGDEIGCIAPAPPGTFDVPPPRAIPNARLRIVDDVNE